VTTPLCCLEVLPGVDPSSLGFTVTTSVTKIDGHHLCLVRVTKPVAKCWFITGERFGGATPLVAWLHRADCGFSTEYPGGKCGVP
jgi:hypothetical protein